MATTNGSGPRSLSGLPMRSMSDIFAAKPEGSDWFIEGILPQGCFLIVGRPKVGKSWLLLQLSITLATGGKFLEHSALGQFEVAYVAAEDDPGRISTRFAHYRVDSAPKNLRFICRDDLAKHAAEFGEHYSLAEFIDVLLFENPSIKAVILDTESTVRAAWEGGSVKRDFSVTRNDYAEVREFDEIAHRRRCFIALVNHTSKRRNAQWIDVHELINRTNTALAGASGSIVLADPPTKSRRSDRCKVLGIRGRDISKDVLLSVEQDEFSMFQSLGPYEDHIQSESELEILDTLKQFAETEPEAWKTSKQLAVYLSRSTGSVQRAITRMIQGKRHQYLGYLIETRTKLGVRLIKADNLR